MIFGLARKSWLYKAVLNIHLSISPSVCKKFFQFERNGRSLWVVHDAMLYDPIQSQDQCLKRSESYENVQFPSLSPPLVCIQSKTNGEVGYYKTISDFLLDRFLTLVLVQRHVTFKRGVTRQFLPYAAYLFNFAVSPAWLCWVIHSSVFGVQLWSWDYNKEFASVERKQC